MIGVTFIVSFFCFFSSSFRLCFMYFLERYRSRGYWLGRDSISVVSSVVR